jgi:hypothetical protein
MRKAYHARIRKYQTGETTSDLIFCDGNNPSGIEGHVRNRSEYIRDYLAGVEGWADSCITEYEIVPTYTFCDESKRDVEICAGGRLNTPLLTSGGEVGQDCGTWSLVSQWLLGDMTVPEARKICRSRLGEP